MSIIVNSFNIQDKLAPQINSLAVFSDDVFGSRILIVALGDELLQLVDVERRHDFREGQILSDGFRHSDLIQRQIGIRRDDSTSRKVHTLTHQVTWK